MKHGMAVRTYSNQIEFRIHTIFFIYFMQWFPVMYVYETNSDFSISVFEVHIADGTI